MRRKGSILAFLLGIGLAAASTTAATASDLQQETTLGAGGELYRIKSGTYGELFPGRPGQDSANPVLRLDVTKPDGTTESTLVPGTEGAEVEGTPFLHYEEASNTVFLIWESRLNVIHPILMLSAFNGSWEWNEPIEIIGHPYSPKTSPQLAVTHDTYEESTAAGSPVTRQRSILHVVWGEETASGSVDTFYTPVILEDGVFTGRSPVLRLNDLDTAAPAPGSTAALSPEIQRALRIQPGRDERTVVTGFVSPRTGRLVTVEIDSLPPQLVQLADKARSHIVDIGVRLFPSQMESLAEKARSHIVDIGVAFHSEVTRTVANDVAAYILTQGRRTGNLNRLADEARSHIVDIGAKLSGRGLRNINAAAISPNIVEIKPATDFAPPDETLGSHLFQLREASDRPAPETGKGQIFLFLSENGEDAVVAWADGDRVLYRESSGAGWKAPLELRLAEGMSLQQALDMLAQRVRRR